MKKIIITGLSVILVLIGFQAKSLAQKTNISVHVHQHNNFGGQHVPYTWTAFIEDQQVYLELTGEDWNSGRTLPLSELGTLPGANEGTFSVTREAGTMTFKGIFEGGKGTGFYKFAESPSFKAYLEQKGYKDLDDELLVHIFLTNINKEYFEYLKANGYASVSSGQLKDLAEQDLNRKVIDDYLSLGKREGWGRQSLDKLIELREHGVNARFVNSFHEMGYKENIPVDKALELRDHGVSPEFIADVQKMSTEKLTLERAVDLRDHGVSTEFIRSMQEMGYKNITLEKAQELKDHGVSPDFIRSIAALGFKDISLDKAQELKDHGVNADFIKKVQNKGMNVHTLDDYIRIRDTGFNE